MAAHCDPAHDISLINACVGQGHHLHDFEFFRGFMRLVLPSVPGFLLLQHLVLQIQLESLAVQPELHVNFVDVLKACRAQRIAVQRIYLLESQHFYALAASPVFAGGGFSPWPILHKFFFKEPQRNRPRQVVGYFQRAADVQVEVDELFSV